MADNKGVLIFGEVIDGKLAPSTLELLGVGRGLADTLGEPLMLVLVGSGVGACAKDGIAYGADKVFVVDDATLKNYTNDAYVSVMEKVVKQVTPNILLLGMTPVVRDLAPRLAFRLGTAVSMDCLKLEIDASSKLLLMTRPYSEATLEASTSAKRRSRRWPPSELRSWTLKIKMIRAQAK